MSLTVNIQVVAVIVFTAITVTWNLSQVWNVSSSAGDLAQLATTVSSFEQKLDGVTLSVSDVEGSLKDVLKELKGNWTRAEQWEFATALQDELHKADVDIRVPKPKRRE